VRVWALGTSLAFGSASAWSEEALERVEITGSRIKRAETEKASPVQILTRDDIDKAARTTLGEYLQTLTADGQGSVPTTFGRGFAGSSAAGISLRGLGANATLVLVNGRRVAPAVLADDAQRTFVDLNTIPLDAIDRIEVLKDGASAVYGSDALAGVVNIILRKTFNGTVTKASYGISEEGDGATPRVALLHGFGDLDKDTYNVLFNLDFTRKDAIYYRDRVGRGTVGKAALYGLGFAPGDTSGFNVMRMAGNGSIPVDPATGVIIRNSASPSIVGNVRYPFAGAPNAPDPNLGNNFSRGNPAGAGFRQTFPGAQANCNALANLPQNDPGQGCISDLWQQFGQAQPDTRNINFFGRLTKRLGEAEAYVELGLSGAESRTLGGGGNVAIVPTGRRSCPTDRCCRTSRRRCWAPLTPTTRMSERPRGCPTTRSMKSGPATFSSRAHSERLLVGLKGEASAWEYDTAILFSQSRQTDNAEARMNRLVSNAFAESHPGERRRRDGVQPRLRRLASRDRVAHRRERRSQLTGAIRRPARGPDAQGLRAQRRRRHQGRSRSRQDRRAPDPYRPGRGIPARGERSGCLRGPRHLPRPAAHELRRFAQCLRRLRRGPCCRSSRSSRRAWRCATTGTPMQDRRQRPESR
jgi:iron complex outermembrane receptor protein